YLPEIVQASEELCTMVAGAARDGRIPLVIGGDHSIGIGTLAGMAQVKQRLGVLWFDTHGDANSPRTTSSGNIHGMPLAVSLGVGDDKLVAVGGSGHKIQAENVVLIGIRNLDQEEREFLRQTRVTVFTMRDIDQLGMKEVMRRALDIVTEDTDGVHVSFDLDVIDPTEAPGVGTPVSGGINYREAHLAMELVAESGIMSSMEVAEVNPILDTRNKTAELAVGLISSAFGKSIF
ncbi:MAG: arginase, partial [Peptococcaceae bacterium]|nr:arginase [Peptococcaceae bacterium]